MKAIGAKNRFILSLFLSDTLLIGLIGSTLGILMGITGAYILTSGFGAAHTRRRQPQSIDE